MSIKDQRHIENYLDDYYTQFSFYNADTDDFMFDRGVFEASDIYGIVINNRRSFGIEMVLPSILLVPIDVLSVPIFTEAIPMDELYE